MRYREGFTWALSSLLTLAASAVLSILSPASSVAQDQGQVTVFPDAAIISGRDLADLRGGFLFSNGLEVRVGLEFVTTINGGPPTINSYDEEHLMSNTGVINKVINDEVTVELTDQFTGIMNRIQNELDGAVIDNPATLNIDLFNVDMAVHSITASDLIGLNSISELR